VAAVAKAAGSVDGLLRRCRRPPPPPHLLLAVGAGAKPALLRLPRTAAAGDGDGPAAGPGRCSCQQRGEGGLVCCLRSTRCKSARGDAAVQRRDAIAQPQRASERRAHQVDGPLAAAVAHVRPPATASTSTRAASSRPIADATYSALSPRLSAKGESAACERCAHTEPPPPPPRRYLALTATLTPPRRTPATREEGPAWPQTASHRLAAAAAGDITRRCVAAAWAGRLTARGTRSRVALEGVAPEARLYRRWDTWA
jgi:hypothetical protein